MPRVSLTCPSCDSDIRVPGPLVPGKKVICPKCEEKFFPEGDEDEDEEEEERPRQRKKKRKQQTPVNVGLILAIAGGGLLVVVIAGVFLILWATGVFDKSSKKTAGGGSSASSSSSSPAIGSPSTPGGWQSVHADKGKFNAKMPGIVLLMDGEFAQAGANWNDQDFNVRTAPMTQFDEGKPLQQVVDDDISIKGKQLTRLTLQGYPGAEVSEDNGKRITRVYISKKVKYTVSVWRVFGQDPVDRTTADQFFNSFQIID
jgi:hypothetical protein